MAQLDESSTAREKDRLAAFGSVKAKIFRFDPEHDSHPAYESYEIPYVEWMTVNDVLGYVTEEIGDDVAYRHFCGVKKCGACAVRVNGREVLSCWEPVQREMVIEPLKHVPIVRDLVHDRAAYEAKVQEIKPFLERRDPYPGFPERLRHSDMANIRALDCINCMACLSACPVLDDSETNFAGPAALVQLAQYALDPRDGMDRGRIAYETASIFDCMGCGDCADACPVDIPIVTDVIEPLKKQAYESLRSEVTNADQEQR